MPINKFLYKNGKWIEEVVGLSSNGQDLVFTHDEKENENVKNYLLPQYTFEGVEILEGDRYEFSIASIKMMSYICMLISQRKQSSGLIIDYGETHSFKDSLRGIMNHKILKQDEILKNSGQCDLSAYVNFAMLKKIVHLFPSLEVGGIHKQGDFLELLGIWQIFEAQGSKALSEKEQQKIEWQYNKLVSSQEMGDTFKVLYVKKAKQSLVYPFTSEVFDKL